MAVAPSTVEEQPLEASDLDPRERRWRIIRRWAAVAFFIVLIVFSLTVGIPEDREGLLLWTVVGLGTQCLGRGWRSFLQILLDWLPFTAALVAYDYTRGFADNLGIATHVMGPIHADLWLGHGTLPTAWLQAHLYHPGQPHWWDAMETLTYTSHFLVTPIAAVILWLRNRREWLIFISRIIALSAAGLLTYVLYPAAPPWMASRDGLIDPVVRISSRGWMVLHFNHAGNLLASAQASVNAVAAMPSLHTATATLVALYFIPRVRWWWKIPLAIYPFLMGWALVYSGEHYLVDLLFGYLYGIVITVASAYVHRWWQRRKAAAAAASNESTEDTVAESV
jgi:membrane-associated phospholipid phosphatase